MRSALLLLLLAGTAAAAPPVRDPDWPCQSVKVPTLSLAAIWTGPPIEAHLKSWRQDEEAANLAQRLAQRRIPIADAEQAVKHFAQDAGEARQDRLLDLMAGLFSMLDAERSNVINGLSRFGHRQKELAAEVRSTMTELRTAQDKPDADQATVTTLSEHVNWGTRVFGERQQSLRYACDVPNLIEERLGVLARAILSALG